MNKKEIEQIALKNSWTKCEDTHGFDYLFEDKKDMEKYTISSLYACKIGANQISWTNYSAEEIKGVVDKGSWALGRSNAIKRLKKLYKELKLEKQTNE